MSIPLKQLSEPFPAEQIKRRKGNFSSQVQYVECSTVIQRLNDTLEGDWSFTIVDYHIGDGEVIVHGRMTIEDVIHEQFGGSQITRKKDSSEVTSIADDLKAAAADSLKKCAGSFGVGAYLYSNGNGTKASKEQISNLFSTAKAAGVHQQEVIKRSQELFNKPVSQLTSTEIDQFIKEYRKENDAKNKSTN